MSNRMAEFEVYRDGVWYDTVFFTADYSESEVRDSLIDHDGYPDDIVVTERVRDDEPDFEDDMTDVEADADTLASAGWGTDEDYGYFGDDDFGEDW